jgi:hypothetical protein
MMYETRTSAKRLAMADHARAIAAGVKDAFAKPMMLYITADCEALARHADFLAASHRIFGPDKELELCASAYGN